MRFRQTQVRSGILRLLRDNDAEFGDRTLAVPFDQENVALGKMGVNAFRIFFQHLIRHGCGPVSLAAFEINLGQHIFRLQDAGRRRVRVKGKTLFQQLHGLIDFVIIKIELAELKADQETFRQGRHYLPQGFLGLIPLFFRGIKLGYFQRHLFGEGHRGQQHVQNGPGLVLFPLVPQQTGKSQFVVDIVRLDGNDFPVQLNGLVHVPLLGCNSGEDNIKIHILGIDLHPLPHEVQGLVSFPASIIDGGEQNIGFRLGYPFIQHVLQDLFRLVVFFQPDENRAFQLFGLDIFRVLLQNKIRFFQSRFRTAGRQQQFAELKLSNNHAGIQFDSLGK